MTPEPSIALRDSDRISDTWRHLKKGLQARQAYLRAKLEGDADERTTANIRGRLAELKWLIDLDLNSPPV